MKVELILFSAACLSALLVPALGMSLVAVPAPKGVLMEELSVSRTPVVIQAKPPQLVIEHKPVETLVPVATIPSVSITNKLVRFFGAICDSITGKIRAVGSIFSSPPNVVVINTTKKPPVLIQVEIPHPHHRVYPVQVSPQFVVGGCADPVNCVY